ncbi:MAG: acetyl-CoA C-acetyltransferase [Anaerolineaceae bacterium]|nr:acetyl-CoA C-acetyltransferase [Anaerolineaceae bacterium]
MKKIFIAEAKRSALGSFQGSLQRMPLVDLGAQVMESVFSNNSIEKAAIEEVYMGNVLQAGNGQNPARQSALKAGIPENVPASTINTVCGSGLHAVGLAYQSILSGNAEVALAGGMESMSTAPHYLKSMRNGLKLSHGEILDSVLSDGLTCPINNYHMGITAENIAVEFNISRQEQDEFAVQSQAKAANAQKLGKFKDEINPLMIKTRKEEVVFEEDEFVKPNTTIETLARLRPCFKKDGSVTPGNASGINDGAAAMLVLSEEKCQELSVDPMAIIHGFSLVGLRPDIMGMGPVYAIRKLREKLNFVMEDIGLWELNEAFAAQSLAVVKELGIPSQKINVNGGAIALGHPIGASGARILVTLLWEMKRTGTRFGVASLCIGTGMGIAMLVENPTA